MKSMERAGLSRGVMLVHGAPGRVSIMRPLLRAWVFCCLLMAGQSLWAGVPVPDLDIGQGGHCVADPAFMKRNHMKMLIHQRDLTVREGIRGGKYSLAVCVDCHASKVNHSVLGSSRNFCQGCHQYAAVRIDCFECHSSQPRAPQAASLDRENLTHPAESPQ